jgi:hypothetical protein
MNLRDDSLTASRYSRGRAPTRKAARVMISSIKIKGYRRFLDYSMSGLGRINLLVGKNNSGKTSILEAIHFLASGQDISPLWQIPSRRGEQVVPDVVAGQHLPAPRTVSCS